MNSFDKLILIFFMDVGSVDRNYANEFLTKLTEYLKMHFDDTVIPVVIPSQSGTEVQCVNPRLVPADDYEQILKNLTELNLKFKDFAKSLSND